MRSLLLVPFLVSLALSALSSNENCRTSLFCDGCIANGCGWCAGTATCIQQSDAAICSANYYQDVSSCSLECSLRWSDVNLPIRKHPNCIVCPDPYRQRQVWYSNATSCDCSVYSSFDQCTLSGRECGWCNETQRCQVSQGSCDRNHWYPDACANYKSHLACTTETSPAQECVWNLPNRTCEFCRNCTLETGEFTRQPPCYYPADLSTCLAANCGWCAVNNSCTDANFQDACPLVEWRNQTLLRGCESFLDLQGCFTSPGCVYCNSSGLCISGAPQSLEQCIDVIEAYPCHLITGLPDCVKLNASGCGWCDQTAKCSHNSLATNASTCTNILDDCSAAGTDAAACASLSVLSGGRQSGCAWCSDTSPWHCQEEEFCQYPVTLPAGAFQTCADCTTFGYIWCAKTGVCQQPSDPCPFDAMIAPTRRNDASPLCEAGITNTSQSCPICLTSSLLSPVWCASVQRCVSPATPCDVPYIFGCGAQINCGVFSLCEFEVLFNQIHIGNEMPCGWCWMTGLAQIGAPQGPTNRTVCPEGQWTFYDCDAVTPRSLVGGITASVIVVFVTYHLLLCYGCSRRFRLSPSFNLTPHSETTSNDTAASMMLVSFILMTIANCVSFVLMVASFAVYISYPRPVIFAVLTVASMLSPLSQLLWISALLHGKLRNWPLAESSWYWMSGAGLGLGLAAFIAMMGYATPLLRTYPVDAHFDIEQPLDWLRWFSFVIAFLIFVSSYSFIGLVVRVMRRIHERHRPISELTSSFGPHLIIGVARLLNLTLFLLCFCDFFTTSFVNSNFYTSLSNPNALLVVPALWCLPFLFFVTIAVLSCAGHVFIAKRRVLRAVFIITLIAQVMALMFVSIRFYSYDPDAVSAQTAVLVACTITDLCAVLYAWNMLTARMTSASVNIVRQPIAQLNHGDARQHGLDLKPYISLKQDMPVETEREDAAL